MLFKGFAFRALALMFAAAGPLSADDTVAVLSDTSGVYMEAFSAFQKGHGKKVSYFDVSKKRPVIPFGTRTVVAFGSRAAAQEYPPDVNLVYTMAPGFIKKRTEGKGATIKIGMTTPPDIFLARLREIQPSMKSLRVFWRAAGYSGLPAEYAAAAARAGLDVSVVKVKRDEELPDMLRAAIGRTDAFWLPPDPLLISELTLSIFIKFSQSSGIPMYVSTSGLARKGACASIGIGFAQLGEAAGAAVKELHDGKKLPRAIYPEKYQLTLNGTAAKYCGLDFAPEVMGAADHYFP
ncbi:MAG: ABC transporter substrate binding protein [Elusimicrobiales bacterium]|nr:ABC transporter substrate binding protein [Elusimicrobiales bacterium]